MTVLVWTPWMEAVAQLVAAHPDEFARYLHTATVSPYWEGCTTCAPMPPQERTLADLLGHDRLGHHAVDSLGRAGIRTVPALLRGLGTGEVEHVYGLGVVSLQRIRHAVAAMERARSTG
ncbi:hypothetical protein ACFV1L_21240 [Kitasatospora sp. NPDC059646]|uniref:hypothetical protein n=1 Tax=Kitasatospora sp. NPDC059646 TaxID=3346893 RepID=UPI0036A6C239